MPICLWIAVLSAASAPAAAVEKIAVTDFATPGLTADQGKSLSDNLVGIVAAETARFGYRVISSADIKAMLSFEKQKDLVGCTEVSCLAEIGGALGVDLLLSGSVGKIGDGYSLTLTLVDSAKAEVRQRFQASAGSEAALAGSAKRGVAVLFGKTADLSGTGMLVVRTEPEGGQVSLDGKLVGQEPVTLDDVPAGDHVLSATSGSRKGSLAVTVVTGSTERLVIQLQEAPPVKIKIVSSPPDATVYLDGEEKGLTPVLLGDVTEGPHHIRVIPPRGVAERYRAFSETRTFSRAEFDKNGGIPFKVDAPLGSRWHLPVAPVLMAGAASSVGLLKKGVATQIEVGAGFGRFFELTLGYAQPFAALVTARGFVYRGGLDTGGWEIGGLARFVIFQAQLDHQWAPAAAGGLTAGRLFAVPWGTFGLRADAMIGVDLRSAVRGLTFPVALSAYWRI